MINLNTLDIKVIRVLSNNYKIDGEEIGLTQLLNKVFENEKEREECIAKLKELGFNKSVE